MTHDLVLPLKGKPRSQLWAIKYPEFLDSQHFNPFPSYAMALPSVEAKSVSPHAFYLSCPGGSCPPLKPHWVPFGEKGRIQINVSINILVWSASMRAISFYLQRTIPWGQTAVVVRLDALKNIEDSEMMSNEIRRFNPWKINENLEYGIRNKWNEMMQGHAMKLKFILLCLSGNLWDIWD